MTGVQTCAFRSTSVFSRNATPSLSGAGFDTEGRSLPAEMIGDTVAGGGVTFNIGPRDNGRANAVACRGQNIKLPQGDWNRIYLLAASADGDTEGVFKIGEQPVALRIQNWGGFIGQWDNRVFEGNTAVSLKAGFIKRDPLAWFCSHRHLKDGKDDPYAYSYLFAYAIDIPVGAATLTLPENEKIKIVAATVSCNGPDVVVPAHPLYDDFTGRQAMELKPEQ